MRKELVTCLIIFIGSTLQATTSHPVEPGSTEEAIISSHLTTALTTQTGCEIATHLFLLKTDFLKKFFGLTEIDAQFISKTCPRSLKTFSSIFYKTPNSRSEKKFILHSGEQNHFLDGFTAPDNLSHLFIRDINDQKIRRVLVHEMMITMDDKFHLQSNDFSKLGFTLNAPPKLICVLDRFLSNPYYQISLSSLRAFWMELRFAHDLNDEFWFDELKKYGLMSLNAQQSFELFVKNTPDLIDTAFVSREYYNDPCSGSQQLTSELSSQDILMLTLRDYNDLKSLLVEEKHLELLMHFLTRQISISALESNLVNSGPRPAVTPGGWSTQLEDKKINTELRKNKIPTLESRDNEEWKRNQLKLLEKLKGETRQFTPRKE